MVGGSVSPVFGWDDGNRVHCRKHGVSIVEIEALLRGTSRIAPDLKHAHFEDRLIAAGCAARGCPCSSPSRSGKGSGNRPSAHSAPGICTRRRSGTMKRNVPRMTTEVIIYLTNTAL